MYHWYQTPNREQKIEETRKYEAQQYNNSTRRATAGAILIGSDSLAGSQHRKDTRALFWRVNREPATMSHCYAALKLTDLISCMKSYASEHYNRITLKATTMLSALQSKNKGFRIQNGQVTHGEDWRQRSDRPNHEIAQCCPWLGIVQ